MFGARTGQFWDEFIRLNTSGVTPVNFLKAL